MSVTLNGLGNKHAAALISAGKVDKDSSWSISADEENAILGSDDWQTYASWHLGVDTGEPPSTKAHYKYPFGKGGKVYRSALIAIRQRAGQQDATGIFDAAGKLIASIDGKSAPFNIETRGSIDCLFDIKSVTDDGIFSGYGSVYDVVDDGGDIIAQGAFADSLSDHAGKGTMPAMLWQHNSREPIGAYKSIVETPRGLMVHGQLALKTQRGAEAYELMKMKALTGLSVGFMTRDDSRDQKTGIRTIKSADLWEISPVTFPMNDAARISAVKSIEEINDFKSAERYLRDSGSLSRSEATALVARIKSLAQRDSGADDEAKAVIAALSRKVELMK